MRKKAPKIQPKAKPSAAPVAPKPELAIPDDEMNIFKQLVSKAKDIDLAKIEALKDMYEGAQLRKAERDFATDFALMKPKLPKVIKSKANDRTESKYAPIEDINQVIDPILAESGFGTSMEVVEQTPQGVSVRTTLFHRSGHSIDTVVFMPFEADDEDNKKNASQDVAAAISFGKRIGLTALLNISTGDDKDGNAASGDYISPATVTKINERIDKHETAYREIFLKYMGVQSVELIPEKQKKRALQALDSRDRRAAKEAAKQ